MSGDLGPDVLPTADLTTVFESYMMVAAGMAADRQDEEAAGALAEADDISVRFSDHPLTTHGDGLRAAVEVTLSYRGNHSDNLAKRLAGLLTEAAHTDGYAVRAVRLDGAT